MKRILIAALATTCIAAPALAGEEWKNVDANKDGAVTKAEFDAGVKAGWDRKDKDGNGQLSQAETGEMTASWKDADADKDGQISAAEYKAKRELSFVRLDKDGNGTISKAEQSAAAADKGGPKVDKGGAKAEKPAG